MKHPRLDSGQNSTCLTNLANRGHYIRKAQSAKRLEVGGAALRQAQALRLEAQFRFQCSGFCLYPLFFLFLTSDTLLLGA